MFELFAKDRATSACAITAKERRNEIESGNRGQTIDELDQMLGTNEINLENFDSTDDIQVPSTATSSHGRLPNKIKPKNKKRKSEEDDAFASKVMSSIDKVAEAIERSTKVFNLFTI